MLEEKIGEIIGYKNKNRGKSNGIKSVSLKRKTKKAFLKQKIELNKTKFDMFFRFLSE